MADKAALVPQFLYDVIARIVPGACGILFTLLATKSTVAGVLALTVGALPGATDSATSVLTLLLSACFLAGLVLSLLGDLLERALTATLPRQFNVLGQVLLDKKGALSPSMRAKLRKALEHDHGIRSASSGANDQARRILILWYDELRRQSPELRQLLTRLRADYRMYAGLAVASFLSAAVHVAYVKLNSGIRLDVALLGSLLAVGALFTWGLVRAFELFQNSIVNHYCASQPEQ